MLLKLGLVDPETFEAYSNPNLLFIADAEEFIASERCAPSILITFINMVLFKTNEVDDAPGCATSGTCCETAYMYAGKFSRYFMSNFVKSIMEYFSGQKWLQRLLVVAALVTVPWMLLMKPFMQMREHNQKASARRQNVNGSGGWSIIHIFT